MLCRFLDHGWKTQDSSGQLTLHSIERRRFTPGKGICLGACRAQDAFATDDIELDEGGRVAKEVNAAFGVKHHGLGRCDFEQKVLERTVSDHLGQVVFLLFRKIFHLAQIVRNGPCGVPHHLHQVVGIDHCAFP